MWSFGLVFGLFCGIIYLPFRDTGKGGFRLTNYEVLSLGLAFLNILIEVLM